SAGAVSATARATVAPDARRTSASGQARATLAASVSLRDGSSSRIRMRIASPSTPGGEPTAPPPSTPPDRDTFDRNTPAQQPAEAPYASAGAGGRPRSAPAPARPLAPRCPPGAGRAAPRPPPPPLDPRCARYARLVSPRRSPAPPVPPAPARTRVP